MAILIFTGPQVLELLAHAKAAAQHSNPYGTTPASGPSLMLVKDDGVYLMSNGVPIQPRGDGKTGAKVVYAKGYEPPRLVSEEDRDGQYSKIAMDVGGDDFVETIDIEAFEIEPSLVLSAVKIELTESSMKVDLIVKPASAAG